MQLNEFIRGHCGFSDKSVPKDRSPGTAASAVGPSLRQPKWLPHTLPGHAPDRDACTPVQCESQENAP